MRRKRPKVVSIHSKRPSALADKAWYSLARRGSKRATRPTVTNGFRGEPPASRQRDGYRRQRMCTAEKHSTEYHRSHFLVAETQSPRSNWPRLCPQKKVFNTQQGREHANTAPPGGDAGPGVVVNVGRPWVCHPRSGARTTHHHTTSSCQYCCQFVAT
jgi:hypothetical protein